MGALELTLSELADITDAALHACQLCEDGEGKRELARGIFTECAVNRAFYLEWAAGADPDTEARIFAEILPRLEAIADQARELF